MWLLIMTVVWWTSATTGTEVKALWLFETRAQCMNAQDALVLSTHPDDAYVHHRTVYACVEKASSPEPDEPAPAPTPQKHI